jgi:HNH endonuclease
MASSLSCFRMPTVIKISARSSSITNAFINSVIPVVVPDESEVGHALALLGLDAEDLRCAFCGDRSTEWDHLRPLVVDKKATGFISEIRNLVPACGKCNQSKGNKPWREWMKSSAPLSPTSRGVRDCADRMSRLEEYERWGGVEPVALEGMVDSALWAEHWENWRSIVDELKSAQRTADIVRKQIAERRTKLR